MRRRELLIGGLGGTVLAAADVWTSTTDTGPERLLPPEKGLIPVAFVISDHATMIDFTGPWEVFQDCIVPGREEEPGPFQLFTVAETADAVRVTGGMQIVPDYSIADAPAPRVVVVPAHRSTEALRAWIVKASAATDLTMSVCTGAFALAKAGLLAGRPATTHHDFLDRLERDFPEVQVRRGLRFVESGRIATAGGLTSGIDLALRVVERYFGRGSAQATAAYMEYQSSGWKT